MLTKTPFEYPYIENADALLREIAFAGVEERYEVETKDRAIARLEEELGYVRFQHSASGYLTVVNALRTVDAMPEDYRMAGTLASSLLSYVLGLSDIDPLNCSPKLYPEFFFGFKGDRLPAFEFWMAPDLHERFLEYFTHRPEADNVTVGYYDDGSVRGVAFGELAKDKSNPSAFFDTFHIVFRKVDDENALVKELVEDPVFEKIKPQTFEEYVRCYGLSRGTDTWEGNGEELLSSGKATFPELIAFREDVYEYLLDHDMERKKAWNIAEIVRKGRMKRYNYEEAFAEAKEDMKAAGIPDWFLWSCQQISYLFPRAHAMVLMKHYWEKIKKLS